MKLVATNCVQLRSLDVSGNSKITDVTMKLVGTNCRQLHSLDVRWTNGAITDESMKLVAANCRQLRLLRVGQMLVSPTITEHSFSPLSEDCVVEEE